MKVTVESLKKMLGEVRFGGYQLPGGPFTKKSPIHELLSEYEFQLPMQEFESLLNEHLMLDMNDPDARTAVFEMLSGDFKISRGWITLSDSGQKALFSTFSEGKLNEVQYLDDAPKLSKSSIDEQIDAMLISFEKNATGKDEFNLEDPANSDNTEDDEGFDAGKFAAKVARLVKNRETLLDTRTVIINRAMKYVTEAHSDDVARKVANHLKDSHNVVPDDEYTERHRAPAGQGAEGIPGGV